jgi:hypothetical protein
MTKEIGLERTIAAFLESFQGLEQFFISEYHHSDIMVIWNALKHHKTTLRRFVHHQRGPPEDEDTADFEQFDNESDFSDLSLTFFEKEMIEWSKDRARHPFNELDLKFLGLCCSPDLLLV